MTPGEKNLEVLEGINTDEGQLKLCDSTAITGSETVTVWVHKARLFTIQKRGKLKSSFGSYVIKHYHWFIIFFCVEMSELMHCNSQKRRC